MQLQEARTPHEQTALQRQIEATDRQKDALVYELLPLLNHCQSRLCPHVYLIFLIC